MGPQRQRLPPPECIGASITNQKAQVLGRKESDQKSRNGQGPSGLNKLRKAISTREKEAVRQKGSEKTIVSEA